MKRDLVWLAIGALFVSLNEWRYQHTLKAIQVQATKTAALMGVATAIVKDATKQMEEGMNDRGL